MALTLLRHTTPLVTPGTCYGATDLALAESFAQEAEAVLDRLPAASCVISSPLTRCRRLAEHVSAAEGLELRIAEPWKEMDFGAWEGQPWDAIPRAELDAWAADFLQFAGHGGESLAQLAARIETGLSAAPRDALVVTHMGCIKAALAARGRPDGWQATLPFGGMVTL